MIGGFSSMASARLCDPMLPRLAAEFGGTISSVSQVVASFAMAYGLTQLGFGPLGDRYGKLRVIFFACIAACLGAVACALAPNLYGLTLARFVAGGMAAGVIPLSIAWIGDSVPYEERQPVMAKLLLGTLSGLILGQMAGGLASDTIGWRGAFWLVAGMYGLCAWRLRHHARATPSHRGAGIAGGWLGLARAYGAVLRMPMATMVLPAVMLEGFLVFAALSFVPSMIHERDQVSLSVASLSVAGFGLGGLVYAWRSQPWLRRLGEQGFARVGGALFGAGILFMLLVPGLPFAMTGCFAAGLGFYMLHNTLQTLGSQISPQARGSAMALFAFSLFFGQTLGVASAAWVVEHWGFAPVLWVSSLATVALGLLLAAQLARARSGPAAG